MKKIKLTQNYEALVDDEDYELVSQYSWHVNISKSKNRTIYAEGTVVIDGKKTTRSIHRLVMKVTNPKIQVDHRDGNGLNNQKNNLRIVTHGQNQRNSLKRTKKSSKYKGVSWLQRDERWVAWIYLDGRNRYLGGFKDEVEAAVAYNKAAKINFGEYASINLIT